MSQAEPPAAAPPALPPAGYYPDPNGQSRWWDGTQWTTHLQPAAVPPPPDYPPPSFAPSGVPAVGVSGAGGAFAQQVETFVSDHKSGLTMLAGGVLAADGLVGLPRIGRPRRVGIAGMLLGLVVGVIMAIVGFAIHASTSNADATQTALVNGTIRSVGMSSTSSGTSCTPTVSYVVGNQQYTVRSTLGSSSMCGDQVGQPMAVAYNPSNPALAHLPEVSAQTGMFALAILILGILLAIGCLLGAIFRGAEIAGGSALMVHSWRNRKT
jgi:Protein of unknown function (DUF2510)/Protein of unknown function (DUF3592)